MAQRGQADDDRGRGADGGGDEEREDEVDVPLRRRDAAHHRADREEGDLAERHLPGPAREDDERDRHDPVDQDRGRLRPLALPVQQVREHEQEAADDHCGRSADEAHLSHAPQLAGHRPHLLRGLPRRRVGLVDPGGAAPLHEQRGDDDEREHRVEQARAVRIGGRREEPPVPPAHTDLQHAERHRARCDPGHVVQATEHQRGERPEQDPVAQDAAERQAEDAGAEERRHEGEERGDRPDEGLQPLHGHAEQRRPVCALRAGTHGDASTGPAQEHHDRQQRERHDDDREQGVRVEHDRLDREVEVERRIDARPQDGRVPPSRQHERGERKQLRQPDGGHREDQAGRAEEAADDHQLDDRTEHGRRHDADAEREEVVEPAERDEQVDERDGQHTEVGLGEVQDPVRPVDQRHPDGDERGEAADDDAAHHDACGRREEHLLDRDQDQGGGDRTDRRRTSRGQPSRTPRRRRARILQRVRRTFGHGPPGGSAGNLPHRCTL
jgi:hypothetical protein